MVLLIALSSLCTVYIQILAQNPIKCKKREVDGSLSQYVRAGWTIDQTDCSENMQALPQQNQSPLFCEGLWAKKTV